MGWFVNLMQCDCKTLYIGRTGRNLSTRFNNQNIDLPFQQESDVAKHQVDNPTHKIDFNNCAILGFSTNWKKPLIKESLYIQKFNSFINIDKQTISLYYLTLNDKKKYLTL